MIYLQRTPWPALYIRTPKWNIIVGRWQDRLFNERYGYVWCRKILGLRLTIRRIEGAAR